MNGISIALFVAGISIITCGCQTARAPCAVRVDSSRTSAVDQGSPPAEAEPLRFEARDEHDAIRHAVGLRFGVIESIIRRNIISTRSPYGYKIKSVDADGPAGRAGLKRGDVLLKWDGRPIKSLKELATWIENAKRGEEIPIVYARRKEERRLLDRRPWVEHDGHIELKP